MRFVTDNVAGYWASRWFLREQRVSLVVGLGGYASAAAVRAAVARDIPTVILEQNAVPSPATHWLARRRRRSAPASMRPARTCPDIAARGHRQPGSARV